MTPGTTVLVCDDHPLFRRGVTSSLAENQNLTVVAEATDGEACIAKLKLYRPQILVVDLSIPLIDGFGVLEWVQSNLPEVTVFVLSMYTEPAYVQRSMELGAAGFIAKEDAQSELLAAMEQRSGVFYTSESIGRSGSTSPPDLQDHELEKALRTVSDAERRVLTLLTESMTSRQIAEELGISTRTVQAHRVSLASKLGAKGHNKLLQTAIKHRAKIVGL